MLLLFVACIESPADTALVVGPNGSEPGPDSALDSAWDSGTDSAWDTQDSGEADCPEGMVCVESFPFTHASTTEGGTRSFDSYSCASSTDESGPEVVYRLKLEEEGFLSLDLQGMGAGADVDVHLLEMLDPDRCIDRGHWAAGALLPPGTYYVVADSWVNGAGEEQSGQYTLQMGQVSVDDMVFEGMTEEVAEAALQALDRAWEEDHTEHTVHGFIDFSRHSSERRLWIWDTAGEELLWKLHVSHGEGSSDPNDAGWAVSFSNTTDSHQSSLGMMLTAEDYTGSNGLSMRVDGLEPGFNDRVRSRYIVLHGGTYARPEVADQYGRLGQSWGCQVVDDRLVDGVIADLQDGFLWSWYPDGDWSENSIYLP